MKSLDFPIVAEYLNLGQVLSLANAGWEAVSTCHLQVSKW